MAQSQKRIIGSEAMKVGPALHVHYLPRRRHAVPVWAWILIGAVSVIAGAWIDSVIGLPLFGAIFAVIGWRLWRAA